MKTPTFKTLLGAAAALFVGAAPIANAETTHAQIQNLRGLQLQHAKIPVLNNQRLQMVIFANRAERQGEMLVGFDTVLSIIRRNADADAILDDWQLDPYPLDAPLPKVLEFWKDRIRYSEGIMNTAEAEIDNNGKRATGTREVHFRSPLLDLDGVGFEADFRRRTISVNSQVRIVIRQSSADPTALLADPKKMPKKYEFITASGDSMLIDSKRDEIMLIGNVRVVEEQGILTCDRLTIFWKSRGDKKYEDVEAAENDLRKSGIERVLADGNVVITKRADPREKVFADHLICDVPKGIVTLSGDSRFPRFVSANGDVLSGKDISFERDAKRGRVTGGCRLEAAPEKNAKGEMAVLKKLVSDTGFFDSNNNCAEFSGNVKMYNGDQSISCARMRIITADRKAEPGKKPSRKFESGTASLLGSPDIGTGGKDLKSADFYDHVVMTDASKSTLSCEHMHADFAPGANGGGTELAGAKWYRNVRVRNSGADGTPPGVITADRGELDNPNNRVTFESRVNGKRDKTTLKCDRLDLYLVSKKSSSAVSGSIAIGTGDGRVIRKIVAAGNTRIDDASGSLDCDKLTLFFTEMPPGVKPKPGMFQAGGSQLTDILADGHVVAVNRASKESSKQAGLLSGKSSGTRKMYADHGRADLTRHLSHFSGSVQIRDDENQLNCDEMFIYGVRKLADIAGPKKKTPQNDPDADPFALTGFTEDNVPAAINLTDDVQLKKILCLGNVRMTRCEVGSKRKQEAGGSRCVYLTEKRVITLTDTPPRRPWLRAEGRQQYGSRIVYDLNDNVFRSYDTDTFTIEPDKQAP